MIFTLRCWWRYVLFLGEHVQWNFRRSGYLGSFIACILNMLIIVVLIRMWYMHSFAVWTIKYNNGVNLRYEISVSGDLGFPMHVYNLSFDLNITIVRLTCVLIEIKYRWVALGESLNQILGTIGGETWYILWRKDIIFQYSKRGFMLMLVLFCLGSW